MDTATAAGLELGAAAVTVPDAASRCRVTSRTILRMLEDRRLKPGPRSGRGRTVSRASIDEWTGVPTGVRLNLLELPDTVLHILRILLADRRGELGRALGLAVSLDIARRDESERFVGFDPPPPVVFYPAPETQSEVVEEVSTLCELAQRLTGISPDSGDLTTLDLWAASLRSDLGRAIVAIRTLQGGEQTPA